MKINLKLWGILLIIGLTSSCLRTFYVRDLLLKDSSMRMAIKKNPDSRQYIHLAQNLSYLRCYAQASIDSRHKAILRTPGYPLFYSIFEYFGIAPKGVLFTQAVLGACIPVIASLLTYMIVGNILASIITGLLCAFSASGIFMTGEIMVDLVFAFVFIGGFYLLYTGISRYSFKRIVSSGATFGIGALFKPTLIFWPFYSIAICYSLAKGIGINLHRKIILIFVIVQLVIMGGWCLRNFLLEGVFTLSTTGAHALRLYLAVEVEEVSRNTSTSKTIVKSIRNNRKKVQQQIDMTLNTGTSFAELQRTQLKETFGILLAHPYNTYLCLARNILENISGPMPWHFFKDSIPRQSLMYRFLPAIIFFNTYMIKIMYLVIILYFTISPWLFKISSDNIFTRRFYIMLSFFLTFVYFASISSVVFWAGPRLVYPAEFALVILFVLSCYTAWETCRSQRFLRA